MEQKQILSLLVNNTHGVLRNVLTLFADSSLNIETITTSQTSQKEVARVTITLYTTDDIIKNIVEKLQEIPVINSIKAFKEDELSSSELLLIKIRVNHLDRVSLFKIAQTYKAKVLDIGQDTVTIEATGNGDEINQLASHLQKMEIVEFARTGLTALEKGDGKL